MLKRGYKLIICVVLVATLFIGSVSGSASAAVATDYDLQSLIWACMFASNLVCEPVDAAFDYAIARAIDPLGLVPAIHQNSVASYMEQSVIKVLPDVVTIDGVAYSDIWLGPEAAQALRLSGLDFVSAYNILNNQSSAVSYVSGAGYSGDVPFYNYGGAIRTPIFVVNGSGSYDIGLFNVTYTQTSSVSGSAIALNPNGSYSSTWYYVNNNLPASFRNQLTINGSRYLVSLARKNANATEYSWVTGSTNIEVPFDNEPFSFDYTSGIIDAPIAEDQGLRIRVPSEHTGSSAQDSYNVHDVVYDYPDIQDGHYVEIDPDINPDFQIDIDLSNRIGELIRTILTVLDLLDNVEIEFDTEPEPQPEPSPEPTPPPSPEPSTPISDQPAEWLDQILRWIQETIAQVKTSTQSLEEALAQILEQVQTLPQQILQDIETAPIDIYRRSLEIIKTVFAPVLLLLKSVIGLWHYVVEWVQATAPVFGSFFGLMNSTNYNLVLPIYASLAGPIVIAVYKRFGK